MLKKFGMLLAAGVVAAMATNAQAGLLETIAPFDGVPDTIKDNSRAQVFRDVGGVWTRQTGGAMTFGDVIVGLIRIDERLPAGSDPGLTVGATDQLFGLYSIQITGTTAGGTIFTHSGTPVGTGLSLNELIDSSHYAGVNLSGTSTGIDGTESFWDNALVAVFEKTGSPNPLSSTADGLAIINGIAGAGSGWTLDAIAGIAAGSSDFLHTAASFGITDPDDPNFAFDERAGMTVFAHNLGAGADFLDVDSQRFPGTGGVTKHDLVIIPVTQVTPASPTLNPNWDLQDSATLQVNILPEPGSMTLLSLGLLGLAGAGYRRRKVEQVNA